MYTVLTDIEAVISSRPLTFIGNDINDGEVITPAHLALGRSLKAIQVYQPNQVPQHQYHLDSSIDKT